MCVYVCVCVCVYTYVCACACPFLVCAETAESVTQLVSTRLNAAAAASSAAVSLPSHVSPPQTNTEGVQASSSASCGVGRAGSVGGGGGGEGDEVGDVAKLREEVKDMLKAFKDAHRRELKVCVCVCVCVCVRARACA
jgi:hypothetical protein